MRVIAGKFRSRELKALVGMETRPTSDRLRETLFNVLTGGNPEALADSVWIDVFAGTGAVGIEAISRGAGMVYFVESAAKAVAVIRGNLKSLGITNGVEVVDKEALRGLKMLNAESIRANYVFLDPPYRMENEYRQVLEFLGQSRCVHSGTTVIAEHDKRFDPGEKFGDLVRTRVLKQGDASLSFYKKSISD